VTTIDLGSGQTSSGFTINEGTIVNVSSGGTAVSFTFSARAASIVASSASRLVWPWFGVKAA
jgi:hypothetical protein